MPGNYYYSLLQRPYRKVRRFVPCHLIAKKLRYFGLSHYCPICQSRLRKFLPFGVKPRPNALCPVCGSLERHRLIWLFMRQKTNLFLPPKKRMLHAAPEACLTKMFQTSEVINYISTDLAPYAMLQMDLTNIYFPDETFDVVYTSHVFEHIPDDRKAMREIFRVLKPHGWAILQVPIINSEVTYEDPSVIDPGERERIFGQSNHVRIYGMDYYHRLSESGFTVHREKLPAQRNQAISWRLGLMQGEEITLCTKA